MTESKKRILIVDDELRTHVKEDSLLRNTGLDASVVIARDIDEAINQLEDWAVDGHAADIVDMDCMVRANLHDVMNWAEELPEELRPRKYFLHSIDPELPFCRVMSDDRLRDTVVPHHTLEWFDIASYGRDRSKPSSTAPGAALREYLNRTWGTRFPLSPAQAEMMRGTDKLLSPREAVRAVEDGLIGQEDALKRLDMDKLGEYLLPRVDRACMDAHPGFSTTPAFGKGVGGAVAGRLAFTAGEADAIKAEGGKVILVLETFVPEDTWLLSRADGVILLGDGTEHLELIVANHGISALMGALTQRVETAGGPKTFVHGAYEGRDDFTPWTAVAGDDVTINGRGLYKGALPVLAPAAGNEMLTILSWADAARETHGGMAVRANADTPEQAARAIALGADGIGLTRTEHMFFQPERLAALRDAVLTDDAGQRQTDFAALKECQKDDLRDIFSLAARAGRPFPVTVRLLDAPPQEFFAPAQVETLARKFGAKNLRGVQLAGKIPGLYGMQAAAMLEAAREAGFGQLEVMVPLVRTLEELKAAKKEIADAAQTGAAGLYRLRSMVETQGAVDAAGGIADEAEGISFGTNDLTSETIGVARNDIPATREWMARRNHVGKSPFLTFAEDVRESMGRAVESARGARPAVDLSVCGHQVAGDMASILVCQQMGIGSISVPASAEYLIPARVAAGQAALISPRRRAPG